MGIHLGLIIVEKFSRNNCGNLREFDRNREFVFFTVEVKFFKKIYTKEYFYS